MNRSPLVAGLVLALLGAGCATTPYNPFKVGRNEILSRVKTVAVAGVSLPDELPQPDQLRSEFETMIVNELKAAGFQVVPAAEFDQIFKRMRDEMGGFFDPNTGKGDEEKVKKVQDLCRRELATKFHADAVLYPAVSVVSAGFRLDQASWDGVTEDTLTGSFLQRLFSGGYKGQIPALSLWVALKDINGDSLYVNGGGLQLISKICRGQFVEVPVTDLLVDAKVKSRSVQIAFAPLRNEDSNKRGQTK